jgi:hypothetical protein
MGVQSLSLYWHKCRAATGHTKNTMSHGLHLLIALLTAGLWLIPWILLCIFASQAPSCSHCGSSYNQPLAVEAKARAQKPRTFRDASTSGGSMKRCPYCAEAVRVDAIKCRHCGSGLEQRFANERRIAVSKSATTSP